MMTAAAEAKMILLKSSHKKKYVELLELLESVESKGGEQYEDEEVFVPHSFSQSRMSAPSACSGWLSCRMVYARRTRSRPRQ